jgi:methionyl-tRNA formyltransferase
MLPEVVWNMPPLGTFNLHGSLLPQYRGAAPINWAVINGETETGVTTFFLQQEIDTGNVIFAEKTPILIDDNAGTIHDKLMMIGASLVVKTVESIKSGNYPQIPQDMSLELKSAPKIFKETCQINWNLSAENIHNFVRGLSPYPASWTILNDKTCKIYKTEIGEIANDSAEIGSFKTDGKTYLDFRSADNWIKVKELQLEGKKRMGIEEFLRGFRV